MAKRPLTDLEVARAVHHNESLRAPEPLELSHDGVLALFEPGSTQEIKVTRDMYAPYEVYMATFGDYDLDCMMGTGRTPLDAITDLLDQAECV